MPDFSSDTLQSARQAGYTDDQIYDYWSQKDLRFDTARQSGYKLDDVASHISAQNAPSLPTQVVQPRMGLADMLFDPDTAQNLRGAVQDVVYSLPGMAAQIPKMAYEGVKFVAGGPQERAQVGTKALSEAVAQGQQMSKDVMSPLGSRESFRGIANLGLMAAPAVGEVLGEAALLGKSKPPIQGEALPQIPETPISPTVQPITEVPTPEAETPTTVGETTATRQVKPVAGDVWYQGVGPEGSTTWVTSNLEKAKIYAGRRGEGGRINVYTPDQVGETAFADQEGNLVSPQEYAKNHSEDTTLQVPPQAEGQPLPKPIQTLDASGKPLPVSEGGAGTQALISKEGETPPTVSETTTGGQADTGSKPVATLERGVTQRQSIGGETPTKRAGSSPAAPPDTGAPLVAAPVSGSGSGLQAPVSKEGIAEAPTTAASEAGQLFAPSEIPFNLRGEEPPPEIGKEGAARAKAEATYAQEKAQTQLFEPELSKEDQARVQEEYEQGLIDEYYQHAERGGEELLDAVKTSGKLPALSHPQVQQFSGELKNIREAYKGPRNERINYADIFSKGAIDIDALTQNLKAKGFDVETPADTLALVEDRIRTGKPLYGSEARGSALADQSFGMGAAASKEALPGQTVTPGVRETGISQALHERRAGGQIDTGEGVSAERMVTRGRELLQHGYDPDAIVDYVEQGGAVTGDEMAVLRAHVENLSKATNRAQDLADANPGDVQLQRDAESAFQNEAEWRQKIKPAATEWHKAGQAMQGETDIDTGTFTGLRRAFMEVKGRDPTDSEKTQLSDLANKTQKADAAVNEVKSRYDEVVKKETADLPPISPDQLAFGENFGAGVNPKSGISDLTRIIWKIAKDGYIDKGVTSLDDTIHGVALDTGLKPDVVRDALTKPKAIRQITNEMYAKMSARRNMVNAAKDYINAKDEPTWKRVIKATWETPFSLAIYGHGTVGGITHAGANIFRPTAWKAYWPDFVNQAKFFAKPGIHEAAMQTLVRDPNFITGKRAGLANDPNLTYTDYGAYAKFFGLQGGRRGFDALKTMRQSMFNAYWGKIPDSVKSDPAAAKEMARGYADMVNHATGVISNSDRGFLATAARAGSPVAFAAKLEASRWARVIGDPVKTADTFARWDQATPAEKSVAIQRTRNAAEFAAVFVGSLYLNQAILSASGSKDKINLTDPSKSDWLKHKIAGHTVAVDGGLLSPIRLLGRLVYDTMVRPRKELHGDTRTTAAIKDIGNYAVGKASPSVSIAKEAMTAESFDGRLLPWSRDASKKPRMTWTEFATSHGPIPLSGATKEIYDSMRERGLSSPDAKSYLRGLAAFGSELTGARVMEIQEPKPKTSRNR